jgi:hypothetical protein
MPHLCYCSQWFLMEFFDGSKGKFFALLELALCMDYKDIVH